MVLKLRLFLTFLHYCIKDVLSFKKIDFLFEAVFSDEKSLAMSTITLLNLIRSTKSTLERRRKMKKKQKRTSVSKTIAC